MMMTYLLPFPCAVDKGDDDNDDYRDDNDEYDDVPILSPCDAVSYLMHN